MHLSCTPIRLFVYFESSFSLFLIQGWEEARLMAAVSEQEEKET